tara:strand:+ start:204 stop:317 length:114 start_codon:yes stop_codon:yes gene_type:complete
MVKPKTKPAQKALKINAELKKPANKNPYSNLHAWLFL